MATPVPRRASPLVPLSARSALQAATRHLHTQVESHLDLASSSVTRRSYTAALRGFWRAYSTLEGELECHADDLARLGLVVSDRRKLPLLRADLAVLGVKVADVTPRRSAMTSLAGALGAMYVMEGATLGGATIRRNVRKVLGIDESSGASFFAPYGDAVGARWQAFCVVLERGLDDARLIQSAADSAVAAFGLIEACLEGEECDGAD